MMQNRLMSFFLGCIALLVVNCTTASEKSGPGEALNHYISAYISGNYEEAYRFLASEDRQAKSLEAYLAERTDSGTFLTRNLHRLMRYDIREMTLVDDGHARGRVDITVPDFNAIVGEISNALQSAAYPEGALDNVSFLRRNVGIFEQRYQTEGLPRRVLQETFDLVREGDQWKIRAESRPRRS